jgi:hypothetical protein
MNSDTGYPEKIVLKGKYGRYEEGRAAGTIKPGHLIKLNGDNELVVHATAAGFAERAFAREDQLQGLTIDDSYADDALVFYYLANPGDEILAWLAAGVNIDEGAGLVSNGDGTLKAVTGSEKQWIGVCREAVDNSAGGAAVRVKIRVV